MIPPLGQVGVLLGEEQVDQQSDRIAGPVGFQDAIQPAQGWNGRIIVPYFEQ